MRQHQTLRGLETACVVFPLQVFGSLSIEVAVRFTCPGNRHALIRWAVLIVRIGEEDVAVFNLAHHHRYPSYIVRRRAVSRAWFAISQ